MACKNEPGAPHGFDRERSMVYDRYVCHCESWSKTESVIRQWAIDYSSWYPSKDAIAELVKRLGI